MCEQWPDSLASHGFRVNSGWVAGSGDTLLAVPDAAVRQPFGAVIEVQLSAVSTQAIPPMLCDLLDLDVGLDADHIGENGHDLRGDDISDSDSVLVFPFQLKATLVGTLTEAQVERRSAFFVAVTQWLAVLQA